MHSYYFPRTLVLGALIVTSLLGFGQNAEAAIKTKDVDATQMTVAKVISETNEARKEEGLAPVTLNTSLAASAQAKADDMVAQKYFAHTTPEGERFWTFIDDAGYDYIYAGENLGTGFQSAEGLVKAWLNSPTHRANLLDAHYTEIGIGLKYGERNGKEGWYVVQHFGSTTI